MVTGAAEKFAVRVRGAVIAMVSGFAALTMLPLHPVNWYPAEGVAVSCKDDAAV
jgi:hypothetical protein